MMLSGNRKCQYYIYVGQFYMRYLSHHLPKIACKITYLKFHSIFPGSIMLNVLISSHINSCGNDYPVCMSHVACLTSPQAASNHLWPQQCHSQPYQHRIQQARRSTWEKWPNKCVPVINMDIQMSAQHSGDTRKQHNEKKAGPWLQKPLITLSLMHICGTRKRTYLIVIYNGKMSSCK